MGLQVLFVPVLNVPLTTKLPYYHVQEPLVIYPMSLGRSQNSIWSLVFSHLARPPVQICLKSLDKTWRVV